MAPRLSPALVIAAVVHAGAVSGLLLVKPIETPRVASVESIIELESELSQSAPPVALALPDPSSVTARVVAPVVSPSRSNPSHVSSASNVEPSAPVETIAAPLASATAAARPIDLGIGDYWKNVAAAAPAGSVRATDSERPEARVERSMHDALNARDVDRGLGGGGPIVTAAHEAASSDGAPDIGSATFDIESEANGKVRSVNVTSIKDGDARRWNDVAHALFALLAPKQLRTTSAGSGLRIHLRVSIDRALPSGSKATTSLGAVPDDVPGSDRVCEGTGLTRKCLKGLPIGITLNSVDITNAGATASRIVRAQILGEDRL